MNSKKQKRRKKLYSRSAKAWSLGIIEVLRVWFLFVDVDSKIDKGELKI